MRYRLGAEDLYWHSSPRGSGSIDRNRILSSTFLFLPLPPATMLRALPLVLLAMPWLGFVLLPTSSAKFVVSVPWVANQSHGYSVSERHEAPRPNEMGR